MGAQPHFSGVPVDQMQVGVVALGFGNRHNGVEPVDTSDKGSYLVRARQGATVLGNVPGRQPKSGSLVHLRRVHGGWTGCKRVRQPPTQRNSSTESTQRKDIKPRQARVRVSPQAIKKRNERVHWECRSCSGLPPSTAPSSLPSHATALQPASRVCAPSGKARKQKTHIRCLHTEHRKAPLLTHHRQPARSTWLTPTPQRGACTRPTQAPVEAGGRW